VAGVKERAHTSVRLTGAVTTAVLAVVLLAVAFALVPGSPVHRGIAQAASVNQLNQKLEDTRVQLQKLRAKIAKAEAARKAAQGDIAALDQQIDEQDRQVRLAASAYNSAADRLAGLRAQLDAVTKDLNRKRAELKRTETDLATQQAVFNSRIANVYKSGGRIAYTAAFFQLGSITQMVERADLLSAIVDQDNAVLSQIKDLKAQVVAQKESLELQRAQAAEVEQEQARVTADLESRAQERQAALDDLESAKAAKRKVVDTAEKNVAAYNKQEDQLLAESDRIGDLLRSASVGSPSAAKGSLYRPVAGAITSAFGYRIHPIFHVRKMHTGVDMHAGMGESIHAATAGTVIQAGWRGGYGKCVVIDHGGGLATLYAHQSELLVEVGQKVKRGEVVGKVGSTGYSTGPHLHFEVRVNGSPVDPQGYL
jgi:murein DD-endopeptidase MepM/ murein hydrolase activator NlpD